MNNITTAFLGLLQSLKPAHYQNGAPKGRGNEQTIHKKSGKTRRGATHKQGTPFRPVSRAFLTLKNGSRVPITPAQYRHPHLGNEAKALDEKMKMEKRKWISV